MVDLDHIQLDTELKQFVTTEQAWHYRIIPKNKENGIVELYIDRQLEIETVKNELEILFGNEISLTPVKTEIIEKTLNKFYLRNNNDLNTDQKIKNEVNRESDDFILHLIREARELNSSDIHIETYEEKCRVRIRIDGQLVERYILEKNEYPPLINKIKIMADLDIAEKRLPQDGRIFYNESSDKFDIRVSILPTLYGEKVVMRLLGNDASEIDIEDLGFRDYDLNNYLKGVKKPNGIILISGPTGSGKTTTLYATLKLLNKTDRNILTIEDPVEYTLPGINQVQLKESIGLNFSQALRTFLRQDPDVIMVGEIRDKETANMAIRAALTGHLVLSTIHTNSAWGTISRLIDMGIPSYLVASTLNLSVAQRLVRLLCKHCKRKVVFKQELLPEGMKLDIIPDVQYEAVGCKSCFHTGYQGRKAVYEVILLNSYLSERIKENIFDIREDLASMNIKTLAQNALELFLNGETSFDEIFPLLYNY